MWFFLAILFPFVALTAKLIVEVTPACVLVRYMPVWPVYRIELRNVATVEPVIYRPHRDWNGYGIRTTKEGCAYTMSGNKAVKLTLHDGTFCLIGASNPDALAQAILEQLDAHDPHPDVSV